ncbi:MAG TPA: aminotransferase class V-fold PLP-dependent enzyme, partial [Candidatus Limnocylindrales bacterium]|nr:aminotransferase class V-fold PLP-dependent enzyme [Candidatus Limnocylindrales bacterium]
MNRGPWSLDPEVTFLSHGTFGACPEPVVAAQAEWRARIEREPIAFLGRGLDAAMVDARTQVGAFLGADPDDLAFVANATTGINTILRSLEFQPGDELLTTDHDYNAVVNAMAFAASRDGARVVLAHVPLTPGGPAAVAEAILAAATPRTRLAVISHVTSPTALVFPIADIVRELGARGIDTLVDAAHAPGMVPIDISALGAAYWTGNAHKWLCAPKGAAVLHVRRDRQAHVRPLVISHGANDARTDRSRFRLEFDWTGTSDPTPFLSIPAAIGFVEGLAPGGWPEVMASNRALVLAGRQAVASRLGVEPGAGEALVGAMAAVPLPIPLGGGDAAAEELRRQLFDEDRIEVPVHGW